LLSHVRVATSVKKSVLVAQVKQRVSPVASAVSSSWTQKNSAPASTARWWTQQVLAGTVFAIEYTTFASASTLNSGTAAFKAKTGRKTGGTTRSSESKKRPKQT
jgi:hypothetical protein